MRAEHVAGYAGTDPSGSGTVKVEAGNAGNGDYVWLAATPGSFFGSIPLMPYEARSIAATLVAAADAAERFTR